MNGKTAKVLLDWSAVIWASFISAILSLPILLLLFPLFIDINSNQIIQYWAAILHGGELIQGASQFQFNQLISCILVHIVISFILATIVAYMTRKTSFVMSIILGSLFGLAYYFINIHSLSFFFNWMQQLQGWPFLLFNMIVGSMTAFFYHSLAIEQWSDPLPISTLKSHL